MKQKIVLILTALRLVPLVSLHAATQTIENNTLSVMYDDVSGRFNVAEKTTGKVFLTNGRLEGDAMKAGVARQKIVVTQTDGSSASLELRGNQPFVFVTKQQMGRKADKLDHKGPSYLDVTKTVLTAFTLDLGKPATELKTMGTGGLRAPDNNPGSYLFLTCADPATRRGVVAGWVTEDRGSGVLFSSVKDGKVEFKAQIDYGHLRIPAGESAQLETLAIGCFDDARIGEELYADAIARNYKIRLHPQVAGYCTWYSDKHGAAGDENSTVELATFAAKELKPFGFSFVQIDDEWQDGGSYNGPRRGFDRVKPNGPYRHGMKPVAEKIQSLGLTAGIWFMPFARNHQDPEYKDRQHWFVKRDNGKPYETSWGGTSLDLTEPEVKAHLAQLIKTIHSWGYNYFKMDGLWTGTATEQIYINDRYQDDHIGNNAPLHDPTKTNIEAYRHGLKLLREAAGPDVFFSGCNVSQNMRSLGGSIGLLDSMRIGPDNGSDWGGVATGPDHGSPLYFLNGRVWWNDPDPSYVRASLPLNQARFLPSWVAITGSFYLNSDWLPDLPAERLEIIKRTVPAHGVTARPVDYFDNRFTTTWLVTDTRQTVRRDVIGLFNFYDSEMKVNNTCEWLGLNRGKSYHAFDFWANEPLPDFTGSLKAKVAPRSCRVIALRGDEGHPVVLSSSRHVTQGIVDITDEAWRSGKLSATSKVVGTDPYELRIAGLTDGGKIWKLVSVDISPRDKAAGVTVSSHESSGLVRVTLQCPKSRDVKWSIHFDGTSP
ncbi:MAG: glycoside hydrolase family 36 protein [Thermoguttaceae bacterium]